MSNEKFKVKFGLAVGDTAATIDGTTGDIVTNGDIQLGGNDIKSSTGQTCITLSANDVTTADYLTSGGNFKSNFGASITDTLSAGGKVVDGNGNILVSNSTLNTTQLPAAAFFDNTTANRQGRVFVREYGQNAGNNTTASTIGAAQLFLEGSRGTAAAPVNVNTANSTTGSLGVGYYDGTRFSSENGVGFNTGLVFQNTEATASETSVFTGSIAPNVLVGTLTVTAVTSGAIHVGQLITGTGVAVGTTITAYGANTFGGVGTYTVNFPQTTASTTITGVGTTAGGGRWVFLTTPTGNKFSATSRQSMMVAGQSATSTQTINGVTVPQNSGLNLSYGNLDAGDTTFVNSAGTIVYKGRGGGNFSVGGSGITQTGVPFEDRCSFNGYIDNGAGSAGNTLTVTSVTSGVLYVGQLIRAVGLSNTTPYFITALGSGSGLTGTYTIASTFQTAGTLLGSGASPVAMAGTPDDIGLAGTNGFNITASRKSTVPGRRVPLKTNDGVYSFNIAAQTGALGTNTNQNVGNFNWIATEDYSTSACGSQFILRTVDTGTTTLSNRLSASSNDITLTANQLNYRNSAGQSYFQVFKDSGNHVSASVNQTRATTASEFALINFQTQRSTDGINYTPTQNNDILGSFKWNGNAYTSTSPGVPAGPGAEIIAKATENWTATANGTRYNFFCMKTGTLNSYDTFGGNPDSFSINSDIITFKNFDSSATLATINSTAATFAKPIVLNGSTSGSVQISAPAVAGTQTYTLPTAQPSTSGLFLTSTTGGAMSWATLGSAANYIEAYSTQDQTNPVANAENLMSFNNTGISNGISIVTNGTTLSRITLANAGVYNIQFSAQFNQTTGGAHNAFIWLKKNGTNVANSAGDTRIAGNGDRIMAAWNYIVSASAGDYYELAWAASDTNVLLDYVAAAGVVPAVASVILTVVPVGA